MFYCKRSQMSFNLSKQEQHALMAIANKINLKRKAEEEPQYEEDDEFDEGDDNADIENLDEPEEQEFEFEEEGF